MIFGNLFGLKERFYVLEYNYVTFNTYTFK